MNGWHMGATAKWPIPIPARAHSPLSSKNREELPDFRLEVSRKVSRSGKRTRSRFGLIRVLLWSFSGPCRAQFGSCEALFHDYLQGKVEISLPAGSFFVLTFILEALLVVRTWNISTIQSIRSRNQDFLNHLEELNGTSGSLPKAKKITVGMKNIQQKAGKRR